MNEEKNLGRCQVAAGSQASQRASIIHRQQFRVSEPGRV